MQYTPEQQAVIDSPATRIAVQAVPGSGKSSTLVGRIVRMVEDGTIQCRLAAVVTFTNAAADEFQERLIESGVDVESLGYIGTIHGLALATIRYHGGTVRMISEHLADRFLDDIIEQLVLKTTRAKIRREYSTGTLQERSDDQIGAIAYRAKLEALEAIEVSNLIGQASRYLAAAGEAAFSQGQDGFDALFVDEFQDTSSADYEFLEALTPRHFFVIGDPNQSIFHFRGAAPDNTRWFLKGGGESFRLTGTFRCSPAICAAASQLFDPEMLSDAMGPGVKLVGIKFSTPSQELEAIVDMLVSFPSPDSFAILCRYTRQVVAISSILKASGIAVLTPEPSPAGYRQAIAAAQLIAAQDGNPELAQLEYETAFGVPVAGANIPESTDNHTVYQFLLAAKVPEDAAKWFCRFFGESLCGGLDRVIVAATIELQDIRTPEGDGIPVTTIHGAKGREWDHVLIPAMEDITMPWPHPSQERLAEERRIFYVAITRARLSVTCTFCEVRDKQFSNGAMEPTAPSRFLKEAGIL